MSRCCSAPLKGQKDCRGTACRAGRGQLADHGAKEIAVLFSAHWRAKVLDLTRTAWSGFTRQRVALVYLWGGVVETVYSEALH